MAIGLKENSPNADPMRFFHVAGSPVGIFRGVHGGNMRSRPTPKDYGYVSVSQDLTDYEDALMEAARVQAKRAALDHAISVFNVAHPKPIPAWADEYLGYLIRQRIEA